MDRAAVDVYKAVVDSEFRKEKQKDG